MTTDSDDDITRHPERDVCSRWVNSPEHRSRTTTLELRSQNNSILDSNGERF